MTMKYPLYPLCLVAAVLSGCTGLGHVQPWEKNYLALPAMSTAGDPLQQRFSEHVYSSKENSSGGAVVGGGGCGCN
jgi:hypothetical protein